MEPRPAKPSARAVKRHNKQTNKQAREEADERDRRRAIREVDVKECAAKGCGRVKGVEEGNPRMKTCGRCKAVHYCSQACQAAHWYGGHKQVCVDNEKKPEKPLTRLQQRALDAYVAVNDAGAGAAFMALTCRVDAHICRTEYKEAFDAMDEFMQTPEMSVPDRFQVMLMQFRLHQTQGQLEEASRLLEELGAFAFDTHSKTEVALLYANAVFNNKQWARALELLEKIVVKLPATSLRLCQCLEAIKICLDSLGNKEKARAAGALALAACVEPDGWYSAACVRLRVQPVEDEDLFTALDTCEAAEKYAKSDGSSVNQRHILRFQRDLLANVYKRQQHASGKAIEPLLVRWMQVEEPILIFAKNHNAHIDQIESLMHTARLLSASGRFDDSLAATQQAADVCVLHNDNAKLVIVLSNLIVLQTNNNDDAAVALTREARAAAILLLPLPSDVVDVAASITKLAKAMRARKFLPTVIAELEVAVALGNQEAVDYLALVRSQQA
jgi:tetratricopeptide (TPR) repeat protein